MGLRYHVVIIVIVTAIMLVVMGSNAARVPKGDEAFLGNDGLWNSRLPRGPVPPSGPSPCHNMLGPYRQSQVVSPQDQTIICP
ncbi:hypothetical protein CTI12_AA568450 [Artemisia annua]|uniref:Uncharacterized protein n=1 Tax=Artemisia annua TaxID=35608 RepID=A0A2U1KSU5_ARTAN|nr:hypothetical protein CTI12_AA568450 [Artemisia annua]